MVPSIDKSNMYQILKDFHLQIQEAVKIANSFEFKNFDIQNVNKIIINGMGGSAIGGDLVRSYTLYETSIPIFINRNYRLPSFADENTLVIISSYSGNTEETNSAYAEAIYKNCKILCITSGGKVEETARKNNHNFVIIPGGLQPRCAIGYSFFTLLILLTKLGFIKDKSAEIHSVIAMVKENSATFSSLDEKVSPALQIAKELKGKLPVIYSSVDVLDVVNLRWRGQISENAKMLAFGNFYPEMNHNELVGWELNKEILKNIVVVFLKDVEDIARIQTRMSITEDIYVKLASAILTIKGEGKTLLERIFYLIYLGDWISYHLAVLNNVDPTPVDAINYLKNKLA